MGLTTRRPTLSPPLPLAELTVSHRICWLYFTPVKQQQVRSHTSDRVHILHIRQLFVDGSKWQHEVTEKYEHLVIALIKKTRKSKDPAQASPTLSQQSTHSLPLSGGSFDFTLKYHPSSLPEGCQGITVLGTGCESGVGGGGRLVGKRCVESQFVTEGLLFAAVGEPVVHPDLSNQVGAQASKLGGRHTPLDTLCPEGGRAH